MFNRLAIKCGSSQYMAQILGYAFNQGYFISGVRELSSWTLGNFNFGSLTLSTCTLFGMYN